MTTKPTQPDTQERRQAQCFGAIVRERREALKMRQDDLALATNVGRRFIIDLEAGKPNCQLGKALVVAAAVGLKPFDAVNPQNSEDPFLPPEIPEMKDGSDA